MYLDTWVRFPPPAPFMKINNFGVIRMKGILTTGTILSYPFLLYHIYDGTNGLLIALLCVMLLHMFSNTFLINRLAKSFITFVDEFKRIIEAKLREFGDE